MKKIVPLTYKFILLASVSFTTAAFAVEPIDPFRVCANISASGSASNAVSCQQVASQARYMSPYGAAVCNTIALSGSSSSAVTCMKNIADLSFDDQAAEVCAAIARSGSASAAATCAKNGAGKSFRPGELAACLSLAHSGSSSSSAECVGRSGYPAPVPGPQPYNQCPDTEGIIQRLHHAQGAITRNNFVRANRVINELIYQLEPCRSQYDNAQTF